MVPPIFLAWAAATFGTRLAASFWDAVLIPGMTRDVPGEPKGIRELAFRKMLQGIGLPFFGDASSWLRDNRYEDPVDLAADAGSIFGGAFGGTGPISRFAIAGGIRTVAAGFQVLGTLISGILSGDQKTIVGNTARLLNESDEARRGFERSGLSIVESVKALASFVVAPSPESLAVALTAGIAGAWGVGATLHSFFEDITGQENPIPGRNPFIVPEGQEFSLETLDPGLKAAVDRISPPEVIRQDRPPTEEEVREALPTIDLPKGILGRGVVVSGQDPATRRVLQAVNLARVPFKLGEGLLRAFGIG